MKLSFKRGAGRLTCLGLALAGALVAAPLSALAAGPFAGFGGAWSGTGTVALADGSSEAIRCKASYTVGDGAAALTIHVVCASDSFKVDLASNLQADGSTFSGNWQEATRQVQGAISGRIPAPGQFQASLEGTGFGIQMSATTNGEEQAVTIVSQGTDVQRVKIKMRRT